MNIESERGLIIDKVVKMRSNAKTAQFLSDALECGAFEGYLENPRGRVDERTRQRNIDILVLYQTTDTTYKQISELYDFAAGGTVRKIIENALKGLHDNCPPDIQR